MKTRAVIPAVSLSIVLAGIAAGQVQKAAPMAEARIHIQKSTAYAHETDVPLKSALLMLDSINFDGKSGFVRLQKGQTTLYIVLSNLEIGCAMQDTYDRKMFLQGSKPRLSPKLPQVQKDEDFVALMLYQQHYDPRKVEAPPLASFITGQPHMLDFYGLTPLGWNPNRKEMEKLLSEYASEHVNSIPEAVHFTGLLFDLAHISAGEKGYRLAGRFDRGSWAWVLSSAKHDFYLDITKHDPPLDPGMLTLVHEGDGWTAEFNMVGPGFKFSGHVPLDMCQPNFIAVN